MKLGPGATVRPYDNALRAEQARQTRERILDAVVRVMARGVADLSIPAVAQEAGVSVPTVYRHFRSKRALLAALAEYTNERIGAIEVPPAHTPEQLIAHLRLAFAALETQDDTVRAAFVSGIGRDFRQSYALPRKHGMFAEALAPITDALDEPDRSHLLAIFSALANSRTLGVFMDDLGLTADQAADSIAWLVHAFERLADIERQRRHP